MPTRAERRRIARELGHMSTKMKRQRPMAAHVQQAIRDDVKARLERQSVILGTPTDPRQLLVPKNETEHKELWVPGR